jgi:uncharacterized protein involved in exopolysaccharide biosynthesis
MPDVIAVLRRRWRSVLAITAIATALAAIITWLLPSKYLSVATALPASSFNADRASIFNKNIQALYSSLGTTDDLDKFVGTAQLDTLYLAAVTDLHLTQHYGFESSRNGVERALQKLKRNSSIAKSEWGELKVKVWDEDRNRAAQIANALMQRLGSLHQELQNKSNQLVLQTLKESRRMVQKDTTANGARFTEGIARSGTMQEYENLVAEYSLMVAANPPALLVVEPARPPLYADTKEKMAYVLLTFFAAFLFSLLLSFYMDGKETRP